jgi:hypothetical protein
MVNTEPAKVERYESKTFSLELMFMCMQ